MSRMFFPLKCYIALNRHFIPAFSLPFFALSHPILSYTVYYSTPLPSPLLSLLYSILCCPTVQYSTVCWLCVSLPLLYYTILYYTVQYSAVPLVPHSWVFHMLYATAQLFHSPQHLRHPHKGLTGRSPIS
jgi:hypothetical protein